jgi:alpha-ketoglutarate-dependent taurine dioxygenase
MRAADGRAIRAAEFLTSRRASAHEHTWETANSFLLVDNHKVLHARGDASAEPQRVLRRINFDIPKGAKL